MDNHWNGRISIGSLFNNLRIGEKIGFGFGIVGLLYLIVIFQYHSTLNLALDNYQKIYRVFEAKKDHAQRIGHNLEEARRSETNFILHRSLIYSNQLESSVAASLLETDALALIDKEGTNSAQQISGLMKRYQKSFLSVVEAWKIKGLDHNSGLQGRFRNTVHELEAKAEFFKTDPLYLQLLQIRRREKDLGLRLEPQYRDQVLKLTEVSAFFLEKKQERNLSQPQPINKLFQHKENLMVKSQP